MTLKPYLKWAGGKSQLLPEIIARLPKFVYQQDFCMVEPFIGGGAFSFWALSELEYLKKLIINDYNTDLINVYRSMQKNPYDLIAELNYLQSDYDKLITLDAKKPYFYEQRELFNQRSLSEVKQASLFIFLNKAGFNGLYRVNKNNQFNVPIGSYKKPTFLDERHILALSEKLQDVVIFVGDYSQTLEAVPKHMPCLFYIDPPYRPISTTASFTAYAEHGFDDAEQIRLAHFCQKLDALGHCFILSNSDPKNHDENDNFFDDLYHGFQIERVRANRTISAKSDGRKEINELLISNCY